MSDRGPAEGSPGAEMLRCDTCGRLSATVSRVVVEAGYNRANSRPLYNCPECYEKKNRERTRGLPPPAP